MIRYRAGYKYQLYETYSVQIGIRVERAISTNYIALSSTGLLDMYDGYAWDGPSGPARDTKNFMQASLVHDALYQLMRMKLLAISFRGLVDDEMRKICLEDGMSKIRAWWTWRGVTQFAAGAADPSARKPVLTAP